MPIFIKAEEETVRLLDHAIDTWHARLRDYDVEISAVMALAKTDEDGEPVGPALTHHGVPAMAKIRVVAHKDRVQGMADAELQIDGDRWAFLNEEERLALLDHELTHLELIVKDGDVEKDDGGRPKLKLRPHDYEFGWFNEIALRHGSNSQEVQQAKTMFDQDGQALFPWLGAGGNSTAERAAAKLAGTLKEHGVTVSASVSKG